MSEEIKDLKKTLGFVPKVTFVVGGPACGKRDMCKKLVEEFDYQYISVGDLMRKEAEAETKEGERLKKTLSDGSLVPTESSVAILVNGMIANPSKAYLVDGFPRTTEQAIHFEQNVLECQTIISFECSSDVLKERCAKRADATGLPEHSPDVYNKKITEFEEQTKATIDYYDKFGKVRKIDANGSDIGKIFDQAK